MSKRLSTVHLDKVIGKKIKVGQQQINDQENSCIIEDQTVEILQKSKQSQQSQQTQQTQQSAQSKQISSKNKQSQQSSQNMIIEQSSKYISQNKKILKNKQNSQKGRQSSEKSYQQFQSRKQGQQSQQSQQNQQISSQNNQFSRQNEQISLQQNQKNSSQNKQISQESISKHDKNIQNVQAIETNQITPWPISGPSQTISKLFIQVLTQGNINIYIKFPYHNQTLTFTSIPKERIIYTRFNFKLKMRQIKQLEEQGRFKPSQSDKVQNIFLKGMAPHFQFIIRNNITNQLLIPNRIKRTKDREYDKYIRQHQLWQSSQQEGNKSDVSFYPFRHYLMYKCLQSQSAYKSFECIMAQFCKQKRSIDLYLLDFNSSTEHSHLKHKLLNYLEDMRSSNQWQPFYLNFNNIQYQIRMHYVIVSASRKQVDWKRLMQSNKMKKCFNMVNTRNYLKVISPCLIDKTQTCLKSIRVVNYNMMNIGENVIQSMGNNNSIGESIQKLIETQRQTQLKQTQKTKYLKQILYRN